LEKQLPIFRAHHGTTNLLTQIIVRCVRHHQIF